MKEEEMIERLKKRGYRVSESRKQEQKTFEPYKAISRPGGITGGFMSEVEVIEEKQKTVRIKNQRGFTSVVSKHEIFEFSQEALDKYNEMQKKLVELSKQEDKVRDESWKYIDSKLKRKYREL